MTEIIDALEWRCFLALENDFANCSGFILSYIHTRELESQKPLR